MMSSQLGRAILSNSSASADQMNGKPDPEGSYGTLDELLEEIAMNARSEIGIDRVDPGLVENPESATRLS